MAKPCTCPACGSDLWKALSLVHSEGIQSIESTTNSSGVGIGVGSGGIGLGLGKSTGQTSGSMQTMLSSKAAPPVEPWNSYNFSAGFLGVLAIIFFLPGWLFARALGFVFGGLAVIFLLIGIIKDREIQEGKIRYKRDLEVWKSSRVCLRCGEFYAPHAIEDLSSTVEQVKQEVGCDERAEKTGEVEKSLMGKESTAVSKQLAVSVADEIQKLAELHRSGFLTSEEFQQQKSKLLK